jgi:hypothetical protein
MEEEMLVVETSNWCHVQETVDRLNKTLKQLLKHMAYYELPFATFQ